jgi:NhaP-type Na+/H+ or K+/H+ antiporter
MAAMTNALWFLVIGLLMLTRGMTATVLRRVPFTSAIIYLAVGILLGPTLLNLFYFDPLKQSALLELMTEIAVLISLFSAGVKMPMPVTWRRWRAPVRLAWVSMSITVALVAGVSCLALGLPLGAGILLGGVLAPTDPVLATDVQIRHPGDSDRLRFNLTCEAGMNDGAAFPFVMLGLGLLGLHELGEFGWRWLLVDVIWATAGAIAIGVLGGVLIAHIGWKLRGMEEKHAVLDDLVGLGLIGVVYGFAVTVSTWGFLAVFVAGVALRQAELRLAGRAGVAKEKLEGEDAHSAALAPAADGKPSLPHIVSVDALVFKEHLERLSELMLVLLLGGMLVRQYWTWHTVGFALFLFLVARPVSVFIGLAGTNTSMRIRSISGWFGVRGIGSIYYLSYAIQHGLPTGLARELIQLTLVVITMSILLHGASVKPLMKQWWRKPAAQGAA